MEELDGQTNIFDALASEQAAEVGIARAYANADDYIKSVLLDAWHAVARRLLTFTTDDIWYEVRNTPLPKFERRVMGWVSRTAAKNGWCVKSDTKPRNSIRKEAHSNPKQVWVSLIYQGGDGQVNS